MSNIMLGRAVAASLSNSRLRVTPKLIGSSRWSSARGGVLSAASSRDTAATAYHGMRFLPLGTQHYFSTTSTFPTPPSTDAQPTTAPHSNRDDTAAVADDATTATSLLLLTEKSSSSSSSSSSSTESSGEFVAAASSDEATMEKYIESTSMDGDTTTEPQSTPRPRAFNPVHFKRGLKKPKENWKKNSLSQSRETSSSSPPSTSPSGVPLPNKPPPTTSKQPPKRFKIAKPKLWSQHLADSGVRVTWTPWVQIAHISPQSSLEAMMEGVQEALDEELKRGIVDIERPFLPHADPIVFRATDPEFNTENTGHAHPYIREARLILSPYARPTGWYVRLANRSLAQALLHRDRKDIKLRIASRRAQVKEYKVSKDAPDKFEGSYPIISDATIRIENCPDGLMKINFLNMFSRFDLTTKHDSVVPWRGTTPDGREASTQTFLVHFADASWARAALRERQGVYMSGHPLRLVQYPRQML